MAYHLRVVIVETGPFTARIRMLLKDEDYRRLQAMLAGIRQERTRRPVGDTETDAQACDRNGVSMKKELFDELLASVREGGAILRGA